ncbi:MAG: hypothetical protein IPK78_09620 [Rhodospirillales bacterium]|nr:hypothetical protein [Rhodospirillales bacterium]
MFPAFARKFKSFLIADTAAGSRARRSVLFQLSLIRRRRHHQRHRRCAREVAGQRTPHHRHAHVAGDDCLDDTRRRISVAVIAVDGVADDGINNSALAAKPPVCPGGNLV